MSKTTTNLKLIKPELTDAADITAMNPNWDAIDASIIGLDEKLDEGLANCSKTNHRHTTADIIGTYPVSKGGTGAVTAENARKNLGIPEYVAECLANANFPSDDHKHSASDITSGTLPISRGGTGANTAEGALDALGISDLLQETVGNLTEQIEEVETSVLDSIGEIGYRVKDVPTSTTKLNGPGYYVGYVSGNGGSYPDPNDPASGKMIFLDTNETFAIPLFYWDGNSVGTTEIATYIMSPWNQVYALRIWNGNFAFEHMTHPTFNNGTTYVDVSDCVTIHLTKLDEE